MNLGHLVCIDTYCFGYGYLTAYEIGGKAIIQANRHGHVKSSPMLAFKSKMLDISKGCKNWITTVNGKKQDQTSTAGDDSSSSD
jgi:serine/threonine protein phosphatase 1